MKKNIFLSLSLALVLGLNIYFRTFLINFPQLKTQAKTIVEEKIQREAIQQIDKNFPEFYNLAKDELIRAHILDYKRQKKGEIKKQIQEEYLKLKDNYQDQNNQTYLMELDCWHWARYVDNVLRLGHPADKMVNGKPLDTLMLAPSGSYMNWNNFLFYISAFLYKIFVMFRPIPLTTFLFFLPLFFITLFIITLYLFSYYYAKHIGAIISCLFVGLAPIFLHRSCAGWFDTDILNLLFPLLIVWTYLIAHDASSLRRRVFWIAFSSFWLGLFSFTWIYWWFIFLIIGMYETFSLLNLIFIYWQYKNKNFILFKQHLLTLIFFLSFSFFWIIFFSGIQPWVSLYIQIKEVLTLNRFLTTSIWPNVYSTVAELGKTDILGISNSTGNRWLFVFSLVCMLVLFLRSAQNKEYSISKHGAIVILTFWFINMYFACFKGLRFTMFLLIPLGVSLGWTIEEAYEYFKKKSKPGIILLVIVITISLGIQLISNAHNTAKGVFPLMNDTWYKLLINLKENTPKEAIINSWWDYGDWFKSVSSRRVIFDGQSQNTPQAYWMAKVLLTDKEEESLGVLRMLNNGGNSAFEIINKQVGDPFKSVSLLKRLILYKPEEAREALLKILPTSLVEEIIGLLFAQPGKAYFVVDYTMPNKISAISYIGNWDFSKVYLAQNFNKKEKSQIIDYLIKLGKDNLQAQRFYQEASLIPQTYLGNWSSETLRFYSGLLLGKEKNGIVFFDNGLVYNLKAQTAYIYSLRNTKYKIPKSLFILESDQLKEIIYPDNALDFSILIFKSKEDYRAIFLDRQLAKSLFVRLYFLNDIPLKHFKLFREEKEQDNYVRVFEIIWE